MRRRATATDASAIVDVVDGDRVVRVRDVDRGVVRFRDVDRDDLFVRRLGWGIGGCPPGLDKKDNGCMPPGQAKKLVGTPLIAATRFAALEPLPRSFRNLYLRRRRLLLSLRRRLSSIGSTATTI